MMSIARGVRLGVKRRRRRNSNYDYYDDDESSGSGKQAEKRLRKENNDDDADDDWNLLNKSGRGKKTITSFRLRKCSSTPPIRIIDEGEEQMDRPTKRKHNKMVDAKEGPSNRELQKGDGVNLSRILFTKNRDFLITYNDRDRPCAADNYFLQYGAQAFPFSDEKIDCLLLRDEKLLKRPNITKLLSSPGCDYVINKEKQEVPVHNLEDKVVAFYFYEGHPIDDATKYIQEAYEQVADKEKFEIVLVYLHNTFTSCECASEKLFWKTFKKMPWLALPFKDPRCSSLQRIFRYPKVFDWSDPDPRLVIIGPRGKFFDPFGLEILKPHGPKAYPFTRQRIAEIAAEYAKKVTLDMFWGPNTYFEQNDGSKVKMSQLVGKRIMLLYDDDNSQDWATFYPKFWQRLKARYLRMKGTDDAFEVISVTSNEKYVGTLPWLMHPPFGEKSKQFKLLMRILTQSDGLLAFDGDGRVVRSTTDPTIERGNNVFPFHAGGIEKEFLDVIVSRFEGRDCYWPLPE